MNRDVNKAGEALPLSCALAGKLGNALRRRWIPERADGGDSHKDIPENCYQSPARAGLMPFKLKLAWETSLAVVGSGETKTFLKQYGLS